MQMDRLSQEGEHGYDTWSWKQYMLALEQENYCDFEVATVSRDKQVARV